MTSIHISIRKPTDGGTDPVTGTLGFAPVMVIDRYFDSEKNLILPDPFTKDLGEDGTVDVNLEPTNERFVWSVSEPSGKTRYVEVPQPASGDNPPAVAYADLVDVDPGTLVPQVALEGTVLKVRVEDTLEAAQQFSVENPGWLVFFDEENTAKTASEGLAAISQYAALAETEASRISLLREQSERDANDLKDAKDNASAFATMAQDAASNAQLASQRAANMAVA